MGNYWRPPFSTKGDETHTNFFRQVIAWDPNKTEILKKTPNPEFGPKAKFTYDINNIDIESNERCLEVTVWDCTGLKRLSYIGGVVLGKESGGTTKSHWLDALSSCGHRVTRWHMLEGDSFGMTGENSSVDLTDQLSYQPPSPWCK